SPAVGPGAVEAAGGSHQCMRRGLRALVSGEGEVGRRALGPRDRHRHGLRAELLMPGFDRVCPRRQPLDREAAVLTGHGVERIGHTPRNAFIQPCTLHSRFTITSAVENVRVVFMPADGWLTLKGRFFLAMALML